MRVLWFTNTPPVSVSGKAKYNGGGWVSSLVEELSGRIDLGVVFISGSREDRTVSGGVTFYPVYDCFDSGRSGRIRKLLFGNSAEISSLLDSFMEIVEEFRPDVIEVFGSERMYGLIAGRTGLPVVLHLQGILDECRRSFLPPGMSRLRYCMSGHGIAGKFGKFYYLVSMRRRCVQERKIFSLVHDYIGRTDWDRKYLQSVNPAAGYHHLDEILRKPFYDNAGMCRMRDGAVPEIVTTISEAPFKGMDIVLRAADILRNRMGKEFVWKVYGNVDVPFFERFTGIDAEKAGVVPAGVAGAETIAAELVNAAVYVHPSYVENSPNSLCEAQMAGVPCVASDTGGIPSIVDDGVTGLLVRPGDAEGFARAVSGLLEDRKLAARIGHDASAAAVRRHDRDRIVSGLLSIYGKL